MFPSFPADPRWIQISAQLSYLLVGIVFLSLKIPLVLIATFLVGTLLSQVVLHFINSRRRCPEWSFGKSLCLKSSCLSAMITSMGLCLFLKTQNLAAAFVIAILAIASKSLIKVKEGNKHPFNPANFGLFVALFGTWAVTFVFPTLMSGGTGLRDPKELLLFFTEPNQFGRSLPFLALILVLGSVTVIRAKVWNVTFGFLVIWLAVSFAIVTYRSAVPLQAWNFVSNPTPFIFAFHMISDPKATPHKALPQFVFGAFVAAVVVLIQQGSSAPLAWKSFAPTIALFAVSALRGLWLSQLNPVRWKSQVKQMLSFGADGQVSVSQNEATLKNG
jgi:enediyne biosynthesis protein E5